MITFINSDRFTSVKLKARDELEQDFWMSILLDVGIGLEINVLTSKFILLSDQMLGEMGCSFEF